MRKLVSALAALALTAGLATAPSFAQDKGSIGIAMPTKSSARWISDGDSMVKQFQEAGYETDLQYAEDDIPNQLAQTVRTSSVPVRCSNCGRILLPE